MMRHENKIRFVLFAVVLVLAFATACTKSTTSAAPADPPQVTVLKYVQLGAQLDNTAAHSLLILCTVQPGQAAASLPPATCSEYKKYMIIFPPVFDAIAAEAGSSDTWAVMRVKIAGIAATATVNATVSDPTMKQEIASIQAVITQILGVQ